MAPDVEGVLSAQWARRGQKDPRAQLVPKRLVGELAREFLLDRTKQLDRESLLASGVTLDQVAQVRQQLVEVLQGQRGRMRRSSRFWSGLRVLVGPADQGEKRSQDAAVDLDVREANDMRFLAGLLPSAWLFGSGGE